MSGIRSCDDEEAVFDLENEGDDSGGPPIGAAYPLSEPLASVLLAWAVGNAPAPFLDGEDLERTSRRVLVVEDDRLSRRVLSRLLTARGWQVAEAGTLAEGIEALDPPPSCLILDLMLPDGDGVELLRHVRAAGLTTRVVIATGVADEARLEAVNGLGPDSLHLKPVDFRAVCRDCCG